MQRQYTRHDDTTSYKGIGRIMKDNIEIINLVPKFLDFYNRAINSDAETRFELWKSHYGFAAVPPTAEGERLIKEQLESSWEKYKTVISFLEQWSPDDGKIQQHLSKVKEALEYDEAIDVVLIFFVGAFEGNAFAAPYGENRIAVCLPIENGENEITIVHELVHLVHSKVSGFTTSWEREVALFVLQEGLAMRLSQYLVPNHDDEDYVGSKDNWLQECNKDAKLIIQGIKQHLRDNSAERVFQFTMGNGTTGKVREGYFAGWKMVGDMLKAGWSFADIARIKEENMADIMENIETTENTTTRKYRSLAVDFDGTLCYSVWPELGPPNEKLIETLKKLREEGTKLILWTCREEETLDEAVEWCKQYGLEFDAVNDNLPEAKEYFQHNSRKVSCDLYIDDRAIYPDDFLIRN